MFYWTVMVLVLNIFLYGWTVIAGWHSQVRLRIIFFYMIEVA